MAVAQFSYLGKIVMYFQMWTTRVMFQLHRVARIIGDVISAYRLHTDSTDSDLIGAVLDHGWGESDV